MSHERAQRIRSSFELVAPKADELVSRFYERLFTDHPSVRSLFPTEMASQKKHLLAAVSLVVKYADRLEALDDALMDMGERHVGYGAVEAHYPAVRDTLLATLEEFAGAAWTPELNEDWTAVLNQIAETMLRGAERSSRQAA